jgi:hypothetical protein
VTGSDRSWLMPLKGFKAASRQRPVVQHRKLP